MMTPEERYHRDPEFRMLVSTLYDSIRRCQYTPTELREAVILAAILYERERPPRPIMMSTDRGRRD